ncbi:MAG: hypothetical protein C5B60_11655 [Chloroflexi bacterium]|nr:MAG: hypothetical protein C5B60_11655 [Chloroflexota bacterium]
MRQSIPHNRGFAAGQPLTRAQFISKVPEVITILFWIAKLLSTALGESTSDYLVFGIDKYVAVGIGFVGLVVALILQLSARRYNAWIYWLAVVMVAVFGTMAADVLHIVILTPALHSASKAYLVATVFFAACLAFIFMWWYLVEKTLSIHSIYTLRRELFYWATVVTTFALGTAAGDFTAYTLHLGYFVSALLFIALILVPAAGFVLFRLNAIAAFWVAYILTRPIGASFADLFGKPTTVTPPGRGLGDGPVAAVLTIAIIIIVGYFAVSRKDMAGDTAQLGR